ncbi:hypothetical protein ACWD4Z_34980 [Streptomyces antibioticus]
MGELLALAAEAADGQRHHKVAVQLPVSLVMMAPIVQALHGQRPLPAADGAGLRVTASALLHGGELPGMVGRSSPTSSGRACPPHSMRCGGRIMPRGDGRPHRRFQCTTLEGDGRSRCSTFL